MSKELLPCPFCGEMPTFHPNDDEMVACLHGDCPMSDAGTCTREEWSARAPSKIECELAALLREAREEIEPTIRFRKNEFGEMRAVPGWVSLAHRIDAILTSISANHTERTTP